MSKPWPEWASSDGFVHGPSGPVVWQVAGERLPTHAIALDALRARQRVDRHAKMTSPRALPEAYTFVRSGEWTGWPVPSELLNGDGAPDARAVAAYVRSQSPRSMPLLEAELEERAADVAALRPAEAPAAPREPSAAEQRAEVALELRRREVEAQEREAAALESLVEALTRWLERAPVTVSTTKAPRAKPPERAPDAVAEPVEGPET